jgi:hypothetical protein
MTEAASTRVNRKARLQLLALSKRLTQLPYCQLDGVKQTLSWSSWDGRMSPAETRALESITNHDVIGRAFRIFRRCLLRHGQI